MSDVTLGIGPPERPEASIDDDLHFDDELGGGHEPPHVDEAMVRPLVSAAGHALHASVGDEDVDNHWIFSDRELDDLVPPLTRIINRRPQLRRAVIHGDEIAVAVVLASYAGRNVADARRAQEAREDGDLEREAGGAPHENGADPGGRFAPPGPWDGGRDPRAGLGVHPPTG